MLLTNDFRVSVAPPKAWAVLTDVERIAPMLPGAKLEEIEGDDFRGLVKVKVGPITAQYKGTAAFEDRNEAEGRVVLKATGRDTRGQGNASATITATLVPDGEGTKVTVVTDLTVTGKVAQFGRGVLADVSSKLIGQFVDALEADLEKDDTPAAVETADVAESAAVSPAAPVAAAAAPLIDAPTVEDAVSPSETAAPVAEVATPSEAGAPVAGDAIPPEAPTVLEPPRIRRIDSPEPEPVDLLDAAGGSVAKRLVPLLGGIGVLILILLIGRSRHR
jgi:carbon monoxide dehydrogenase subunit G